MIRELIEEKAPKVLHKLAKAGMTWQVHFAFFARAGFTDAARRGVAAHQALLIDLASLDQALHE